MWQPEVPTTTATANVSPKQAEDKKRENAGETGSKLKKQKKSQDADEGQGSTTAAGSSVRGVPSEKASDVEMKSEGPDCLQNKQNG